MAATKKSNLEQYHLDILQELKSKGLKSCRNEDSDYLDENGNKRYGVNIENQSGDVLDYEYFNKENEAIEFINELNN